MATKKFRPVTPSLRNTTVSDFAEITKKTPEKSLLTVKKEKAGRNSYGRITVRHQGGGNRQKYRIIDFKRQKEDMPATVVGIEYDPNRSANIALIIRMLCGKECLPCLRKRKSWIRAAPVFPSKEVKRSISKM